METFLIGRRDGTSLAFGWVRMILEILQCTGQPPRAKKNVIKNADKAKIEKCRTGSGPGFCVHQESNCFSVLSGGTFYDRRIYLMPVLSNMIASNMQSQNSLNVAV